MNDLLTEKIYISEEGEKLIKIAMRQYNFMAVIYFFSSLLSVIIYTSRVFKYQDESFDNWGYSYSYQVLPYLGILQLTLSVASFLYYLKGIRFQKRATVESDQSLFDKSLELYKNGNIFSIGVISLSVLFEVISFYLEFSI